MRILMFGAGVIGTIYGYVLTQVGVDVTHYVRAGKQQILEKGISLRLLDGRSQRPQTTSVLYQPKLVEALSPADDYDFYIVSVRHYQLYRTYALGAKQSRNLRDSGIVAHEQLRNSY